jgi:uncharacterized protein (DUF58 family)
VGLVAADEQLVWLPPQGGEAQRWQILLSLAKISLGKHSLSELLMRMHPMMGRNTSLVIITPSMDRKWVEALIPLMERGVIPTVLLLDPLSFGGSSDPAYIQPSLIDLGVTHYLISRDLLEKATAHLEQREGEDDRSIDKIFGTRKVARESWKVVL